jgi:hypothetical protein
LNYSSAVALRATLLPRQFVLREKEMASHVPANRAARVGPHLTSKVFAKDGDAGEIEPGNLRQVRSSGFVRFRTFNTGRALSSDNARRFGVVSENRYGAVSCVRAKKKSGVLL